jgi:uncharacterized protein YggU (UPF0235/DUF167 family)
LTLPQLVLNIKIDPNSKDLRIELEFSKHSLASCIRSREKQGKSS